MSFQTEFSKCICLEQESPFTEKIHLGCLYKTGICSLTIEICIEVSASTGFNWAQSASFTEVKLCKSYPEMNKQVWTEKHMIKVWNI